MNESPSDRWGLSSEELRSAIEAGMSRLDQLQEDGEHLGQYSELMRMVALTAYHRAEELIEANNRRLSEQLAAAGITLPANRGGV
jgi:hypothetical protein